MLVVDTSAALSAVLAEPHVRRLERRLATDGDLHAPHLIDVEVLHALRGRFLRRVIDEDNARAARRAFAELPLMRHTHRPLADRIWELRHNFSAYDAAFVALAEALEVPLVTCDAKLAGAAGHGAAIELFAP